MTKSLEEASARESALKAEVRSKQSEVSSLQSKLATSQTSMDSGKLSELELNLKAKQERIEQLEQVLAKERTERSAQEDVAQSKIIDLQKHLEIANARKLEKDQTITDLRSKVIDLESSLKKLSRKLDK